MNQRRENHSGIIFLGLRAARARVPGRLPFRLKLATIQSRKEKKNLYHLIELHKRINKQVLQDSVNRRLENLFSQIIDGALKDRRDKSAHSIVGYDAPII